MSDFYDNGQNAADNNTIYVGYDWDNIRFSLYNATTPTYSPPMQDTAGVDDAYDFGSAMPAVSIWPSATARSERSATRSTRPSTATSATGRTAYLLMQASSDRASYVIV